MFAKIVGVFIIVTGILIIKQAIHERKKCLNTVWGKVIEIKEEISSDTKTIYYNPVFEYIVNSEKYIKNSKSSYVRNVYYIGKPVKIYYNSENPYDSYEENLNHKYIIIVGTIMAIQGFMLLFWC